MTEKADLEKSVVLIYDKECPFCDAYCQRIQISKRAGQLRIIDAREDSKVMQEITNSGLDIDQGMVLKIGARLYYGADAIHALALISSRLDLFNRLNYWAFRSPRLSRLSYPVLRTFRNLALKVMRKSKINNLHKPDNATF